MKKVCHSRGSSRERECKSTELPKNQRKEVRLLVLAREQTKFSGERDDLDLNFGGRGNLSRREGGQRKVR